MTHANDKEAKQQKRKEWNTKNKDKLAQYARRHYHKKVQEDPAYRKLLSERVKLNRLARQMNKVSVA